ncbi:MAG: ABC transporter permease, partial [Bacteroidota bacterium]
MIKNYFKTIVRNLWRNIPHTSVNILGLALGITCSLVLYLMISYFSGFDKFQANYDKIYRVFTAVNTENGERTYSPGMPSPLPDAMREEFPEIEKGVFIYSKYGKTLVGVEDEQNDLRYFEVRGSIIYAESAYFDVFTTKIVTGNPNPLLGPNKVVISSELARQYFQDRNPIGEILMLDKEVPLTVTAVIEEAPKNTAFPFAMLISYETIKKSEANSGWNNFEWGNQFYAIIDSEEKVRQVEKRLSDFTSKYYGENELSRTYNLQPFSELQSDRRLGNYGPFVIAEGEYLSMILIALFMITTACINFINLSTAMAIKRSKEVGIRKVLGSSRFQLMMQYLGETFVVSGIALLISIGLAEILIVNLNVYLNIQIQISLLTDTALQLFLLGLWLGVTILAGLYPSLVLSNYRPVQALKNLITTKNAGKFSLRRVLVVFQLTISFIYVLGTIVLLRQLDFMRHSDPGFTTSGIVVLPIPEEDITKSKSLKTELLQLNAVDKVSLSNALPLSVVTSATTIEVGG